MLAHKSFFIGGLVALVSILTIAYAEDPPQEVWNKVYDSGYHDMAYNIAVDGSGFVYVAGGSSNGSKADFVTIKYDSYGNIQWDKAYDSSNDMAYGVTVDGSGFVYVAGGSSNGSNSDFMTIKYDPDGNVRWDKVYDSGDDDEATGIAVDASGFVYVTGYSLNGRDSDFRTIKYKQATGVQEVPVSLNLELDVDAFACVPVKISYELPAAAAVELSVYDACGREVAALARGLQSAGRHAYLWTPDGAGVYFARLQTGTAKETRKFVAVR